MKNPFQFSDDEYRDNDTAVKQYKEYDNPFHLKLANEDFCKKRINEKQSSETELMGVLQLLSKSTSATAC